MLSCVTAAMGDKQNLFLTRMKTIRSQELVQSNIVDNCFALYQFQLPSANSGQDGLQRPCDPARIKEV